MSGKQVFIQLSAKLTKEKMRERDRLVSFWFAKAQRFQHKQNPNLQCIVIRPFNGEPVITMWGPPGRDDDWLRAVRYRDSWYLLDQDETWEFNFQLNEKVTKLLGVRLFLNGKRINTYH